MMDHWSVSNYVDPPDGGTWIYYVNPNFPDIHMSRCLANGARDHMATNDRAYYYFGIGSTTNTFNMPYHIESMLRSAWKDYFSV